MKRTRRPPRLLFRPTRGRSSTAGKSRASDVDKAYQRTRDVSQPASEEETLAAKLSLLDDLILQDILLAKAKTLNLEVAQTDLDTAYNNAKKNMTDDAFQQELTRRGLNVADMREGLRRELMTQKLIAQEVGSKVTVTDQEVADAFNANRAQFNVAEESYRLAQIVVTPGREPQVGQHDRRRRHDSATGCRESPDADGALESRRVVSRSRHQLFGGSAVCAARRGLGARADSRLNQAPPPLRNAVIGKEPGAVNVAAAGMARTPSCWWCRTRGLDSATCRRPECATDHRDTPRAQRAASARRIPHRGAEGRQGGQLPGAPAGRVERHRAKPSTCSASWAITASATSSTAIRSHRRSIDAVFVPLSDARSRGRQDRA